MQKVRFYSSKVIFYLCLVLCLLWAGVIFKMSHETAVASAERSGGFSDVVASVLVENFEELSESEKEDILSQIDHVIRKIAHFGIFTILGALLTLVFLYFDITWKWHWIAPLGSGVLYALSDEIHQYFIPGRAQRLGDVVIDSFGVLCGTAFIILIAYFIMKKTR